MLVFITVSNSLYKEAKRMNGRMAIKKGNFDKVVLYDTGDIDDEFQQTHDAILSQKRGAGLWLWKPYFVWKAINEECHDGDYLFYLDAAAFFIRDAHSLVSVMEDDILASPLPYVENEFTKREVFDILNMNGDVFEKTNQFQASYMMFRKSSRSVKFVKEWLDLSCNYAIISPNCESQIQIPQYKEHRMDQSVFSLLCKKYNVFPCQDISQYRYIGYPYLRGCSYSLLSNINKSPFCILLHRRKSYNILTAILFLLKDVLIAFNNWIYRLILCFYRN